MRTITFLSAFLLTVAAFAQDDFLSGNKASFEGENKFLPVEEAYQSSVSVSGDTITIDFSAQPSYYLYQYQFKAQARNAEEAVSLPLEFKEQGKLKYDELQKKELVVYYDGVSLTAPKPDLAAPYELKVTSQACADAGLCYPPRHQFFSVDADGGTNEVAASSFTNSQSNTGRGISTTTAQTSNEPAQAPLLPLVILGAMLGGLILNLMPCVFPVLSLKALSFASSSADKHKQHLHGWAYTAGVVGSFVVAAIAIIAARGAGESLGWGFQLQQPGFVALMAYLFFVMGLSLSGVFYFGTSFMGAGQSLTQGHSLKSSFFTGVLAALVASPCTAPFMATALGFALTQPAYIALLIFAALGFGMSLPFILLSYSPALANHLPAPGPWMDTLKQALAFPLYLTSVWLLWVLGNQTSSTGAMAVLVGAVLITFGIWLLQRSHKSSLGKIVKRGFAAASIIVALSLGFNSGDFRESESGLWEPYSAARLGAERSAGNPVFIDLTADWCITCKVNEKVALNTQEVARFVVLNDIVMLQGDWTNADPEISALLDEFNRSGVPLYLMYPAGGGEPEVLPQILTKAMVLRAMEKAVDVNVAKMSSIVGDFP